MKIFSLKALGAFIFAAGLVVAGVAAPAFATATPVITPQGTLPSFTAGQAAPAFSVTVDPSGASWGSFTSVNILKSDSTNLWSVRTCGSATNAISALTLPACGVTVTATSGAFSAAPTIYVSTGTFYIRNLGTATFTLDFDNTVFTAANSAGNYNLVVNNTNGGVTTGQMAFTVAGAPKTVTFMPNGGSGSPTTQTASSTTALTANAFTRSGYTFSGWNSAADGSGFNTADGATYNFLSDRTYYAKWTVATPNAPSTPAASLTMGATTGGVVAGSSVAVSASGLQTTASYTVTVQSTPQTIGSGNAVNGAVSTNVTLPSGLEAGWHTLTFISTASDGSALESKYYFKISASGTLLSTSSTIPAELANTGVDETSAILLLAGGLSLALVGAEMFMIARRKRSN